MATTDDPELVKKAKDKAKRAEVGRYNVIKGILSTVHGRKWIYETLEMCGIYSISANPNMEGDGISLALKSWFSEGQRNIGNKLLADIQACAPAEYLRMLKEAREAE